VIPGGQKGCSAMLRRRRQQGVAGSRALSLGSATSVQQSGQVLLLLLLLLLSWHSYHLLRSWHLVLPSLSWPLLLPLLTWHLYRRCCIADTH